MRKNKGFTLIELLAVILILGIVVTLTSMGVSKYLKTSKEKIKVQAKNEIIEMAKAYMATNNVNSVNVKTLCDEGYLEADVINPTTGKNITNSDELKYMYVFKINSEYRFSDIVDDNNEETNNEYDIDPKKVCEQCLIVPGAVCNSSNCYESYDIIDENNKIVISNVNCSEDQSSEYQITKVDSYDKEEKILVKEENEENEENNIYFDGSLEKDASYYSISFEVVAEEGEQESIFDNCIIGIESNEDGKSTEAFFYNNGVKKNKDNKKNDFKYEKSENGFIVTIYYIINFKRIYLRKNYKPKSANPNKGFCKAKIISVYEKN